NTTEKDREMPIFGQELFVSAQAKGALDSQEYLEAHERAKRLAGTDGIDAALQKDHLDALIAPTMGPAWITDWVTGDHFLGGATSTAAAAAGYLYITRHMALFYGLRVGFRSVPTARS